MVVLDHLGVTVLRAHRRELEQQGLLKEFTAGIYLLSKYLRAHRRELAERADEQGQ